MVRIERLGDSFASITFGGEALADFESSGFDDHVKFSFLNGAGELIKRDYTPRAFDRETHELTIDFLIHGHGEGSDWAERAALRAPAIISGPKNSMVIPTDYDWHLLIGDAAAIPAIHRRLAELPENTEAIVIIHAERAGDRRRFDCAAGLDVRWVEAQDELMEQLRATSLPKGEGFAWGAGEAGLMARLRDMLINEKHHPREAMRLSAYWRIGEGTFHQTLERGEAQTAA